MKHSRCIPFLSIFLFTCPSLLAQVATNVVISEFATRAGSAGNQAGEFIELYNPTGRALGIAGWRLEYQAANGSSYSVLATIPPGTIIRARSYYLLTSASWIGAPASDLRWTGNGIADNGNIRIVTAGGDVIDRVGFGTGNNPEGQAAPNHGGDPNDNSVERKASSHSTAGSLAAGGTEEYEGNAWDSNNNSVDFVVQVNGRNPQNSFSSAEPRLPEGSGTVSTLLSSVHGSEIFDLPLVFRPSMEITVEVIGIIVPHVFLWSGKIEDVLLDDNVTADVQIRGDTVLLAGIQIAGDSALITLRRLTAPSGTGYYTFVFLSGSTVRLEPLERSPSLFVRGGPIPIADVRANDDTGVPVRLNDVVTIRGIVTVANEFASPSFVQDHTGGITVFDPAFSSSVMIGDEIILTGRIAQFNGLTEMREVEIDARLSGGNSIDPLPVTITDILMDGLDGIEVYEGTLVRINRVTVNTAVWNAGGAGANYLLSDGVAELDVRIDGDMALGGQPAPGGSFDIIGVLSQFKREAPFAGGYQLMPRLFSDVIATGPGIVRQPVETDIFPDRVSIDWSCAVAAKAHVRYGCTDAYEKGVVTSGSGSAVEQRVTLSGLEPATVYKVQAFSVTEEDTSASRPFYVSSASRSSSGEIIVSFNQEVDNSLFQNTPARGGVNFLQRLLQRIDAAQHSIDLCLYSLSGFPGSEIVSRLLAARNRGVSIRAIFETDNRYASAIGMLRDNVPLIFDNFDRVNGGSGFQHNKFIVIDARDGARDTDDWVLTGSWNPTQSGTFDDAQNLIEIQDQALAVAYTLEFEEMWGSSTDAPDSSLARFGARKRDNTPHRFSIGPERIPLELYFSPSDNATGRIVSEAERAKHSIFFALMTFTREDIARTLVNRRKAAVSVRGVMDNSTDQGSRFTYLLGNGIDVHLAGGLPGMLHHKYMIVDGMDQTSGTASVLTGSHNWTNAAENANNENTLIIRDARIAAQYVQEWYKRYRDAGGTAVLLLGANELAANASGLQIAAVYPNPVLSGAIITTELHLPENVTCTLTLHDVLGRRVAELGQEVGTGNVRSLSIGTAGLHAGMYTLRASDGNAAHQAKILVLAR